MRITCRMTLAARLIRGGFCYLSRRDGGGLSPENTAWATVGAVVYSAMARVAPASLAISERGGASSPALMGRARQKQSSPGPTRPELLPGLHLMLSDASDPRKLSRGLPIRPGVVACPAGFTAYQSVSRPSQPLRYATRRRPRIVKFATASIQVVSKKREPETRQSPGTKCRGFLSHVPIPCVVKRKHGMA
jgi:hypothetical protein